jgi:hypothetical protein
MQTAVKTSRTTSRFTVYQNEMADRIFELLLGEGFETLSELVKTILTKKDYELILYAFYFKCNAGWLKRIVGSMKKSCSKSKFH